MGACFTCCQATQSVITQTCDEKFGDMARSASAVEQQPTHSGPEFHRCERPFLDTHVILTNSNSEPNSNSKSLSLTEKLILPILSTACIENKRSNREFSESKIAALFEQYRDPHEDAVLCEGIERLCRDLGVPPEDFRILVLAWKFDAKQMFCFTRDEFVQGCRILKVDSISDIQAKFPDIIHEVLYSEAFKELYRFTFRFGLESGQRVLASEMAIQLWRLVFCRNEPPILERWLTFLENHPHIKGISKDTWNMFLNFSESVGNDLSSYDDTAAWPSLFDDFVEYENDQTNQNVVPSKEKLDI